MPMTPAADDDHRARQFLDLEDFVRIEHRCAIEGNMRWPVGPGADGEQNGGGSDGHDFTVAFHHFHGVGVDEACRAANVLHAVAGELVLQHLDLVIERDEQAAAQIVGVDLLLDAIGTAVKTALAPAGEIERGFAQGLGRDGAGMHGNTADTAAFLDDQNLLFELGGLNGGPSSRRTAADNNQIELVHEKPRNRMHFDTGCRIRRGVVAKWS